MPSIASGTSVRRRERLLRDPRRPREGFQQGGCPGAGTGPGRGRAAWPGGPRGTERPGGSAFPGRRAHSRGTEPRPGPRARLGGARLARPPSSPWSVAAVGLTGAWAVGTRPSVPSRPAGPGLLGEAGPSAGQACRTGVFANGYLKVRFEKIDKKNTSGVSGASVSISGAAGSKRRPGHLSSPGPRWYLARTRMCRSGWQRAEAECRHGDPAPGSQLCRGLDTTRVVCAEKGGSMCAVLELPQGKGLAGQLWPHPASGGAGGGAWGGVTGSPSVRPGGAGPQDRLAFLRGRVGSEASEWELGLWSVPTGGKGHPLCLLSMQLPPDVAVLEHPGLGCSWPSGTLQTAPLCSAGSSLGGGGRKPSCLQTRPQHLTPHAIPTSRGAGGLSVWQPVCDCSGVRWATDCLRQGRGMGRWSGQGWGGPPLPETFLTSPAPGSPSTLGAALRPGPQLPTGPSGQQAPRWLRKLLSRLRRGERARDRGPAGQCSRE